MKVLITGAGGILGRAAAEEFAKQQISVVPLTHLELDVTQYQRISEAIGEHQPDAVLNCAAYTNVDATESHEEDAFVINAAGARCVAENCAAEGIRVIYPSTDYVFGGDGSTPWRPYQDRHPINAYGRSKLAGEDATRSAPKHYIIRTSWLFGSGGPNFVRTIATRLRDGGGVRVVADQTGRPTYARDLACAIGQLLIQNATSGTYHIANEGAATWYDFAREIASLLGNDEDITPCTSEEFPRPARRPKYSVLDTTRTDQLIGPLRDWRAALADAIRSEDY